MSTFSPKKTPNPKASVAASLFHPTISITDLKKTYTGTHNNVSTKFINAHVSTPDEFILSLLFGVCCLSQFLFLTTSQTIVSITANKQELF